MVLSQFGLLNGVDVEGVLIDILTEDGHLELPDCYRVAELLSTELFKYVVIIEKEDADERS